MKITALEHLMESICRQQVREVLQITGVESNSCVMPCCSMFHVISRQRAYWAAPRYDGATHVKPKEVFYWSQKDNCHSQVNESSYRIH